MAMHVWRIEPNRQFRIAFPLLLSLCVSGCAVDTGLQNIAQECQDEDATALAAEYPSPDVIAQHDKLKEASHELEQKAVADSLAGNPQASDQDTNQEVQDSMDADGLYDYQSKQNAADQCWAMLADLAGAEQQQWVQLQEQISQDNASRSEALAIQLAQQPSPPPAPQASSSPQLVKSPAPPQKTWMDTPYAAMVPPALRDLPAGDGGAGEAAIPPVARDGVQ